MIRIVTDTASDMTFTEAKELGIELVALPVTFDGIDYYPEYDEGFHEFFRLLESEKELPKTSQPSPERYLSIFLDAKKNDDTVVVITISSGLSGTFGSAQTAMAMSEYDNIFIIDSRHATLSQRMLVNYAVRMRDTGKNAQEIAEAVEAARDKITVSGIVNTLTYLKKGGRIPPALALVGTALNIKPLATLKDGVMEMLGKARGFGKAKSILTLEIEKQKLNPEWPVYFGYVCDKEDSEQYMLETTAKLGLRNTSLFPIGSVIGTHLGPGCILVAFVRE